MKVIVISPHPDDETLGASGTLLKYKNAGHKIYWLNVTNRKEEYGFARKKVDERQSQIENVKKAYGFEKFFDLGLMPAGVDGMSLQPIIKKISEIFKEIEPDIVILPHKNDVHSDHRVTFNAAYACTKVFRYPSIKKVMMMEVPSETEFAVPYESFMPNYFVDISDYMERKIKIMCLYGDEFKGHPFPRSEGSFRALGSMRGSQTGCKYAEAFMVIKEIW